MSSRMQNVINSHKEAQRGTKREVISNSHSRTSEKTRQGTGGKETTLRFKGVACWKPDYVSAVLHAGRNRRPAEGRLSRQALHPKDVAWAQTPGSPQWTCRVSDAMLWPRASRPLGLPSKIPNALHALRQPAPHSGLLQASFSGHDAELTAQPLIANSCPADRPVAYWFRLRRVGFASPFALSERELVKDA